MIDAVFSGILIACLLLGALAWQFWGRRIPIYSRVTQAGGNSLLSLQTKNGAYWTLQPLGRFLVRLGISANAITLASIPFAALAATAFAYRHYGAASFFAALSFSCDALDGLVARATGTASDSGEILDAACDRICEGLMFGGLAIAARDSISLLVLVMLAGLGAQQVTLASAKSEIYTHSDPTFSVPRGSMRRAERAAVMIMGAIFSGVLEAIPNVRAYAIAPLLFSLALIAVVGNASALHRFWAIAYQLRRHDHTRHEVSHAAQ